MSNENLNKKREILSLINQIEQYIDQLANDGVLNSEGRKIKWLLIRKLSTLTPEAKILALRLKKSDQEQNFLTIIKEIKYYIENLL